MTAGLALAHMSYCQEQDCNRVNREPVYVRHGRRHCVDYGRNKISPAYVHLFLRDVMHLPEHPPC